MSLQSTSMLRSGASHLASAAPSGAAVGYVYVRDKDTATSVTTKCNAWFYYTIPRKRNLLKVEEFYST